jgi:hypothetical protein
VGSILIPRLFSVLASADSFSILHSPAQRSGERSTTVEHPVRHPQRNRADKRLPFPTDIDRSIYVVCLFRNVAASVIEALTSGTEPYWGSPPPTSGHGFVMKGRTTPPTTINGYGGHSP